MGVSFTGLSMKEERATATVSCSKSAGSALASALKKMRPLPRVAMSFNKPASQSLSLPRPITLIVAPAAVISSMSVR